MSLRDKNIFLQSKDEELVIACQGPKSKEAFELLFLRYRELIYGVCLKYFGSDQEAHDISMSLYELLPKRIKGKVIEKFRPWLYVVVKNYCFEELRRRKARLPKQEQADFMYSEQVFHPDNIHDEALLKKLKQCLDKLKEEQFTAIDLFYFKQVNYDEIASRLKIDWKKVRSYIQNGRRNLKICMHA